ncbi:hypothetical protein BJ878DRAFT_529775 [Calycina marina]|uniref:Uncharacterized protein n=1 Tax=Calycina marina TaxID=1763456 RepID=A0A9P8CC53_9HELO|nr:hypothetical protein BJ878DRAFT_529775 [Calycina marina]
MSAEVVAKKRGRPKKVVAEPIEVVESVKKTTNRAKTTKVAATKVVPAKSKAITAKPVASTKTSPSQPLKAPSKMTNSTPATSKSETPSNAANITKIPSAKPASDRAETKSKIVNEGSKILDQVQEKLGLLPADIFTNAKPIEKLAEPISEILQMPAGLSTTPVAAPILTDTKLEQESRLLRSQTTLPDMAKNSPKASKPYPKTAPKAPAAKVPFTDLNKSIVNNISTREGARPSTIGKLLPSNYKSSARKLTMVMVAIPILIFSSYGLYQRSDEVKLLFNPASKKVEANAKPTAPPPTTA